MLTVFIASLIAAVAAGLGVLTVATIRVRLAIRADERRYQEFRDAMTAVQIDGSAK